MSSPRGPINGTSIKLYVDNQLIAYAQNASISISMDTRDVTNYESNAWETTIEGQRSWSLSTDGLYAWRTETADAYGADDVWEDYLHNRKQIVVLFGARLPQQFNGDSWYKGMAWITDISINSGTESNATYSITLKGSGPLDFRRYPYNWIL